MELSVLPKTCKEAKALGLRHYFTGKPCKYGHVARRLVSKKACAECDRISSEKFREENLEEVRASHRGYNRTEKRRGYNRELKRSEKGRQARKAHYERNKQKVAKQVAEWKSKNLERVKSNRKAWTNKNLEARRAYCLNRKALLMGSEGTHTKLDVLAMYEKQRGKCLCCAIALGCGYHVDHKQPLSKGGGNAPNNLQLLCAPCNLKKSNKDYHTWCDENGILAES